MQKDILALPKYFSKKFIQHSLMNKKAYFPSANRLQLAHNRFETLFLCGNTETTRCWKEMIEKVGKFQLAWNISRYNNQPLEQAFNWMFNLAESYKSKAKENPSENFVNGAKFKGNEGTEWKWLIWCG